MKTANKAVLLSAFAFPGAGHLYLKRYWRGMVIVLLAFAGLGYIIWATTVSALSRLDDAMSKMQNGVTNLHELSAIAGSKMSTPVPYYDAVFCVIICLWIFAIIDAYRIGKQRENQNEQKSEFVNVYKEKHNTKED